MTGKWPERNFAATQIPTPWTLTNSGKSERIWQDLTTFSGGVSFHQRKAEPDDQVKRQTMMMQVTLFDTWDVFYFCMGTASLLLLILLALRINQRVFISQFSNPLWSVKHVRLCHSVQELLPLAKNVVGDSWKDHGCTDLLRIFKARSEEMWDWHSILSTSMYTSM